MDWMTFAFRRDSQERARLMGIEKSWHEEDRLVERAGVRPTTMHATQEEADREGLEKLRKLRAVDPSVEWVVCVANPYRGVGSGTGRCYPVKEPPTA